MTTFDYGQGAELGSIGLWWRDSSGQLIDFTTGHTFSVLIGDPLSAALVTKTTGITGAAGAGVEPTGTPNLVIDWTALDLGSLTIPAGLREVIHPMFVRATRTSDSKDRDYPKALFVRIYRRPS